ncbi:MAG TPA: hypothetical protein VE504_07680 [Nitrososphaeraceae archaeon]|nr:hypothetical protein [Nitrososphaeraceae archaeon]
MSKEKALGLRGTVVFCCAAKWKMASEDMTQYISEIEYYTLPFQ